MNMIMVDEFPAQDQTGPAGFPKIDRREFLKLTGGGIIVWFTLRDTSALAQRREYPSDFNAYLRISADGRVACFTGKVELGQGAVTSLAQLAADELDTSLDVVDMVMGDTDLCPWDMGTFGSMTIRFFGPALRAAAAEARAVLIGLAAERLNVPGDQLSVENGVVFDRQNASARVSYGELAKGQVIERHLQTKPAVKKIGEMRLIGKPELRRDSLEKVTGAAEFTGDLKLPGLLYARILRPPAHGAKLLSADTSAAEQVSGVRVLRDGDFIAVLHQYPDVAEQALEKIVARFDTPESQVDDTSIFQHLLTVDGRRSVVEQEGDLAAGAQMAGTVVEATYLNSYVAHAPMEPHTATADVKNGKATVWASTQAPFRIKDQVASALGFPPENVRIMTPFVGGGFGGKSPAPQAVEAARLSKMAGVPVQVQYSRAEEFFYDTFRPAAVVKIRSGLTTAGRIAFWDYMVYFAGDRGSQHFYDIPHSLTASIGGNGAHPFGTGAWRAPGNNTNTFARECHIDALAASAGKDPVEFRLLNMKNARMRRVLQAAADTFGWTGKTSPSGRGIGVACGTDVGTYVAHLAEVAVDKTSGHVQVKRVVCAQDMGLVVNPEGAKIQMEGCITMGLGYALSEEIHFKGGDILDRNFDSYELPRFSWLPKIETVFVDAQNETAQGGGEPAIICMGGVIANAVFDATGARMLQLPMTPDRIKDAVRKL